MKIITIVAEDAAGSAVVDGIAFARGTGLLCDAQAWISSEAGDLFTASTAAHTA